MKRIGLILALAVLAGSSLAQTPTPTVTPTATPTPWNFPLITQHPNGFDERPAVNANMQRSTVGTADDPFTTLSLGLNVDLDGTIRIRGGAPAAGYVLTSDDSIGSAQWTSPTAVVVPSLAGPSFTGPSGVPTYYPQISSTSAAENELPFGTMFVTETKFTNRGTCFAARGRGSIGALDYLENSDLVGGMAFFVPVDATNWGSGSYIVGYASEAHSSGVNPMGIAIGANDIIDIGATNRVNITATTTTMQTNLIIDAVGPGDGYLFVRGNAGITGDLFVDSPSQATFGGAVQLGSGSSDDIYNLGTNQNDQRFVTGTNVSLDHGNSGSIAGFATLVAGTVTVSTTATPGTPAILHARQAAGGTLGHLSIANVVGGTSFDIVSSSATETSVIYWEIKPYF